MTPLLTYQTGLTATQAAGSAIIASVVVPELQAAYDVPNNTVLPVVGYNAGGAPVVGPIFRGLKAVSGVVEAGAGITAGAVRILGLRADGNWHLLTTGVTLATATNYWFSIGPGFAVGSWTFSAGSIPVLGLAFQMGVALVGAINYVELFALAEPIDPGFIYGSKLGALMQ